MFNTTHDAILLIFVALYVLAALVRAIQVAGMPMRYKPSQWNLTLPLLIAAALAIVAVIW